MTNIGNQPAPTPNPERPRRPPFDRRARTPAPSRAWRANKAIISEFQPDAAEIEERTPPHVSKLILYALAALIAATATWASLAHVETVVTAQGKLTATTPKLIVQPLETSVIKDIRVAVGDVVHRGQILAMLDPTLTQADQQQLETKVSALDAAVNRLRAEIAGRDYVPADPTAADAAMQRQLFLQRKAVFNAGVRNYDAQIASARAGVTSSKDEEALLLKRLDTLQAIEAMRKLLMNKELGSRLNFLLSQDARLEVENNLARARGNEADYTHRVEKAEAERRAFMEDNRRASEQELVETLAKRDSAAEDLKKAKFRKQLVALRAPADSVVVEMADRSVGSVVKEAEPLFMLMPEHVPLRAEVNVEGKDIAKVNVGQSARIKLDAYPFQKFGTLPGDVHVISRDSFAPDKSEAQRHGTSFYRVQVDVRDPDRGTRSHEMHLIPGMTVTAEMKVGERSVISYFLYPILRGIDESIREP
jgi:HlyD family secretion protein